MSSKILITGGAGFVGYHCAKKFNDLGFGIVCLDNFNDYYSVQLKRDRAQSLYKQGIVVLEGDICDQQLLETLFAKYKFTHVLNLAAQVGVRYSVVNPQAYIKTNIEGFCNVLEMCRHHGKIPCIYASSSSVYGKNKELPFSEKHVTEFPASLYGATKKANELMAYSYHDMYQVPVTGLRFFTVYGPWGRPDMAVYSFTQAIAQEREIELYNHGDMARDFTYIDDIVDGICAAVKLAAPCEVFNLGNHKPERLNSLVGYIERELDMKAHKRNVPMQIGDVHETFADISHSQKRLGFHPKVSLEEGVSRFITWFKDYYASVV